MQSVRACYFHCGCMARSAYFAVLGARSRTHRLAEGLLGCLAAISVFGLLSAGGTSDAVAASGPSGGVNVEPSIRPWRYAGGNPQSWWCVMPNCTSDFNANGQGPMPTVTYELQSAKTLGAVWVRVEVPWPLIEPAAGVWDWSRMDAIMQASQSAGEPIMPILSWTPQWAGGGTGLNAPATNVSDWTTFVTSLMQRYGSRFPAVDVWNEPDGGNYLYNGSAQTYVTSILNPAYNAIKAVSPGTPVVLAGSANDSGSCCPFLSAVLGAGGKFDIAAFHNYAGTWGAEAGSYRSALNSAGRASTPLWMTEFSVASASGNQSAAIQSVFGAAGPLQLAAWYNIRDTGAWTCCPAALASSATWGLLNSDFSAKPSWTAMESLIAGRTAPPPPPNLGSSTPPPGSGSSGGGGSGGMPSASSPGQTASAAAEPASAGPKSVLVTDTAARVAHAVRDVVSRDDPYISSPAPASAIATTSTATRMGVPPSLIAGAATLGVVAGFSLWFVLRRRSAHARRG